MPSEEEVNGDQGLADPTGPKTILLDGRRLVMLGDGTSSERSEAQPVKQTAQYLEEEGEEEIVTPVQSPQPPQPEH